MHGVLSGLLRALCLYLVVYGAAFPRLTCLWIPLVGASEVLSASQDTHVLALHLPWAE